MFKYILILFVLGVLLLKFVMIVVVPFLIITAVVMTATYIIKLKLNKGKNHV